MCLAYLSPKLQNYNNTQHKYYRHQIFEKIFFFNLFKHECFLYVFVPGCHIAGDGFCDDATNDGRCDFDGGDCCLPDKNTKYCEFYCLFY